MAKQPTPAELAQSLADLDFNVSDEEISLAKQLWLQTGQDEKFVQIKTVNHPVYFYFLFKHLYLI